MVRRRSVHLSSKFFGNSSIRAAIFILHFQVALISRKLIFFSNVITI